MANEKSSVLEEHDIQRLSDYEHARIRTEMYLGSREAQHKPVLIFSDSGYKVKDVEWVPALITAFREIIDNSLDEFKKAGIAEGILKVEYDEDELLFSVSDNGRGIPIDYDKTFGNHLCTMVLTETKTGRNFDDSKRNGIGGTNGLGGSITMCVSSEASIEICRSGRPNINDKDNSYTGMYKFTQTFKEGSTFFPDMLIEEPVIKKVKSDKTGTTIKFKLSKSVFKNHQLPIELIYSLLKEIACANPMYKIYLNGKKINSKGGVEKTLFNETKLSTLHVQDAEMNFDSTFYIIPNGVSHESMTMHIHGLVNNIPAFDGGTHLETFKKNFAVGIIKALEKDSKKKGLRPNRSDVEEGLLIYNITVMNAPYFSSQPKTQLINKEVIKPIEKSMDEDFYKEVIKKNSAWIDEIYRRCAERTNKKNDDEDRKLAKRLLKSKVAKLSDANNSDRTQCILIIAEGDSAVSNLSGARDPKIHGILPLRGKIINVSGTERAAKLMESQALHDIMSALNLVPGVKAVREDMYYGKLYIAADEDEDGKNIGALVCNFLYKFWPELFADPENPFVYIFKTPFIILEKKGQPTQYFYGHNIDEYHPHEWDGYKATRAKGLGTLSISNFKDALHNGYAIAITDDGHLGDVLDLIFNKKRADDRKEWLKE